MSSNRCPFVTFALALFLLCAAPAALRAQDTPKVEIGVQVTALDLGDFKLAVPNLGDSQRGVGGRVTFNVTDNISVEGEVNTFPNNFRLTLPQLGQLVSNKLTRDRVDQFLFGVKVGARSKYFGIFGKLRPGYVRSVLTSEVTNVNPSLSTTFRTSSGWALDVGGVLEFYPSKHTMLRFDLGDTIIRYETKSQTGTGPTTSTSKFTNHNLQVSAGFGLRF